MKASHEFYYSYSQVAEATGYTSASVRNWVLKGDVPGYLVGGHPMISKGDLEDFFRSYPNRRRLPSRELGEPTALLQRVQVKLNAASTAAYQREYNLQLSLRYYSEWWNRATVVVYGRSPRAVPPGKVHYMLLIQKNGGGYWASLCGNFRPAYEPEMTHGPVVCLRCSEWAKKASLDLSKVRDLHYRTRNNTPSTERIHPK